MPRNRPLGYSIGECWAWGLTLPPGPGRDSCHWLYSHVFDWVRFMAKLSEFYDDPQAFEERTMQKLRVARDLGLRIVLTIDGWNSAASKDEYHLERYDPPEAMNVAVRKILNQVGLGSRDVLECGNEDYYGRRGSGLLIEEYRDQVVRPYVEGADQAGFRGQVWASQTGGAFRDYPGPWDTYWEKTVTWPHGMGEVRHSWVLDRRPEDPERFYDEIMEQFYNEHRSRDKSWKGWEHPIVEDEFSATGKQIHCNTQLAYDMQTAACRAFRHPHIDAPFGHLTMYLDDDNWRRPGAQGWGMSTHLVKSDGEFSLLAKALADDKGVSLPEVGEPPPPPPPVADGLASLRRAENYIGRSIRNWPTHKGVKQARKAKGFIDDALATIE